MELVSILNIISFVLLNQPVRIFSIALRVKTKRAISMSDLFEWNHWINLDACSTTNCPITSCPCLQQIASSAAQCICFPPSSCVSGSTVIPRTNASTVTTTTTTTTTTTVLPIQTSTVTNASSVCQCVNGGICSTNGTCLCSSFYAGRFCQLSTLFLQKVSMDNFLIDILDNPCANYCRNNGICSVTCTDTSCGSPSCTCTNGYSGAQCDVISAGACQPNPCVNGNCIVSINSSYQCQCINGFFGTRCDLSKK